MGGSKETTEQSTKREPWVPAQGNLRTSLTNAGNLAGDVNNFKPQYSGTYNDSLDRMEGLANGQSSANQYLQPVVQGSTENHGIGQDYLRNVAGGDPSSNPYFEDMLKRQQDSTSNAVKSLFSGSGRLARPDQYGNNANASLVKVMTDRMGEQELNARYQNFSAQQGRQDNAASSLFGQGFQGAQLAPNLDQSNYQQAGMLQNVGTQRNAQLDAENTAGLRANDWLTRQSLPIAGAGGTSESTSVQSSKPSTMSQVIGGATAAAGIMSGNPMMAMNGFGSMSGGGGGGLLAGGIAPGSSGVPW